MPVSPPRAMPSTTPNPSESRAVLRPSAIWHYGFGESASGEEEESIMSRPFGVALLIAGYDEDGPSLYHAEPSGTFYRYDAKAIGSGSEGAQAELQASYHKSLTLAEAEELVLKTLKQVMEEKLDANNVQLASVTKDKGFRVYADDEMKSCVGRIENE
ncbi:putative proteasome subunit alpha type-5 [Hortaea werneckii EXF-2000]|uniref:Putative proteasome subunit alpha type-5 n=1 Tax=Hortaea werneckii EXF-2000 TaxID=1157616 RepID=A0A1Z5SUD1_HORWE|nr:putative proteasome subunit alpha type-5 [Hortaea werneckii EXF-2000]